MTSKERVLAAICRRPTDQIPCDFSASAPMVSKLLRHYGFAEYEQILQHFGSDIRYIGPAYTGPPLADYIDRDGLRVEKVYWGYTQKYHPTGDGEYPMNVDYPWDFAETPEDIDQAEFAHPDMFDYESIKAQCDTHRDKALMIGGGGVYQFATFMRESSRLYMDMAMQPELAQRIFDRFVEFELEHYERILVAGDGQIDILVCNDDYGTQSGMLFSQDMWRRFFMENTKRLVSLAHSYGARYMQHSCGAVRPIIPLLVECGVDLLDPIQKTVGMEPEGLKADFGHAITFHGGIDTQWLLPGGTPAEVAAETRRFIDVLGEGGGYILAPSQGLQTDVPVENIEAMYQDHIHR